MKKIAVKVIVLIAVMLAVFVGCSNTTGKSGTGAEAPFAKQSAEQVYMDGTHGDYLAGWHVKEAFADCGGCHGKDIAIDDNDSVVNANCEECHGTYEDLRAEAKANKGDAISAHDGHLAEISCTACHAGHVQSFAYCNNCHIFDMKIAFPRQKVSYVPEDLSTYKDAVPNRVEQADLVIVGAGGSGMVAAMEAAKTGKKVILLEKMPIIGGSSLLSTGGINGAGTSIQKAAGIVDTPEAFFEATLKIGQGTNDVPINKVLAARSAEAVEWFLEKGGELTIDPSSVYAGTGVSRIHFTNTGGIGRYMTRILAKELDNSGAIVRVNSKVVRLEKDGKGVVNRVLVKGKNTGLYEIQAKAVILATGSYGNNNALVAKYNPSYYGMVASTQPGAHGDGIYLAEEVGAEVSGLEIVQIHPNIAANTSIMITFAMRSSGGILVNKEGKRFMNDNAPRNVMGPEILKQTGQSVWLIYDDSVVEKRQKIHEGYVRLGFIIEGDNPSDLAKKLNIPVDTFVSTMKGYADIVANQKDVDFDREELPEPLTKGKLYAMDVIPAIGGTLGGIKANAAMEVLDDNGNPIPGLFASGEVVGGWHGNDRYAGNAVAGNIVFGKVSAENALKFMEQAK